MSDCYSKTIAKVQSNQLPAPASDESTWTSYQSPAPAACHLHQLPVNCTRCQLPVSAVSVMHQLPDTCTSCQSPAPAASHLHQLPVPCISFQSHSPAASHPHQLPVTCTSGQSPAPASSYLHQLPVDPLPPLECVLTGVASCVDVLILRPHTVRYVSKILTEVIKKN